MCDGTPPDFVPQSWDKKALLEDSRPVRNGTASVEDRCLCWRVGLSAVPRSSRRQPGRALRWLATKESLDPPPNSTLDGMPGSLEDAFMSGWCGVSSSSGWRVRNGSRCCLCVPAQVTI